MMVIVIGVAVLLAMIEIGLGARPGSSSEWFPSLAILSLLIIGCARSKLNDRGTMYPATSLWPLYFMPALFVGIHTLLQQWWSGGFRDLRSPVYLAGCASTTGGLVSVCFWYATRRVRHRPNTFRSLVNVTHASRMLFAVAAVMSLLAGVRRVTHPSPETVQGTQGTLVAPALHLPEGTILNRLDETHTLVLGDSPRRREFLSRSLAIRDEQAHQQPLIGSPFFRAYADTRVAVIRPLKLLVIESANPQGTLVCRWDSDCRRLTPLTLGQHLAPPMGWIAMGLFALWFASIASRKVDPQLAKWKSAQYTLSHEIMVDGVRCTKIHQQIQLPNGAGDCWVICDELPESEHPFRGTADKRVEQFSLIDPALIELRYRQWALSSAVLMLLPLVIAAFARMVTG